MPGLLLCADFSIFPDNHTFPAAFALASYGFAQLGSGSGWIVNDTGGERGLQFNSSGIEITLAVPSTSVTIRIGVFTAEPVEIEALDSTNSVVRRNTIPGGSPYRDVRIFAPEIVSLRVTGGGGEAVIPRVCMIICD